MFSLLYLWTASTIFLPCTLVLVVHITCTFCSLPIIIPKCLEIFEINWQDDEKAHCLPHAVR